MKKYAMYVLFFALGFTVASVTRCENEPCNIVEEYTKIAELHTRNNMLEKRNTVAKKDIIAIQKEKDSLKKATVLLQKENKRIRNHKITYNVNLDTSHSKEEFRAELIKADSSNKNKDSNIVVLDEIIDKQIKTIAKDSIEIQRLNEINSNEKQVSSNLSAENDYKTSENKALKKTIRKVKAKLFFTRVAIIAGTVVLIVVLL